MGQLWHDLRYGIRALSKAPSFTLIAILTMALGIGANTAIFSVIDAVLLRPLPYQDPAHLVTVSEARAPNDIANRMDVAPGVLLDWSERNHVFERMCGFYTASFNLTSEGPPERIIGAATSATLFPLLGVHPFLGREFRQIEDRYEAQRVVVLGYPLWQRRFHGEPGIVGKSVSLNGIRWTVIGIMPATFRFLDQEAELYVPIQQ